LSGLAAGTCHAKDEQGSFSPKPTARRPCPAHFTRASCPESARVVVVSIALLIRSMETPTPAWAICRTAAAPASSCGRKRHKTPRTRGNGAHATWHALPRPGALPIQAPLLQVRPGRGGRMDRQVHCAGGVSTCPQRTGLRSPVVVGLLPTRAGDYPAAQRGEFEGLRKCPSVYPRAFSCFSISGRLHPPRRLPGARSHPMPAGG